MASSPVRQTEELERRVYEVDVQLQDLERRLQDLQERVHSVEERLLNASARRIHDFERRLEHEWVALRQIHEEPLKTAEQRMASVTENCLALVRDALTLLHGRASVDATGVSSGQEHVPPAEQIPLYSKSARWFVISAFVTLLAAGAYITWRLATELRGATARTIATEQQVSELQQIIERETRATEQTAQRINAEALIAAARTERMVNVLAAPDLRQYSLIGQRAAAAASGHLLWSSSRGAILAASRLPAPSSKEIYQVWMTTTRGALSLGFVSSDAQGRAGASFDAPPELPGNVVGFMLTLEPTGGNVKPTGPVVLASS
jgi:exonuclease VII large subunit